MCKKDKIAVLCSALLLVGILAIGAVGLSRTYHYDETTVEQNATDFSSQRR